MPNEINYLEWERRQSQAVRAIADQFRNGAPRLQARWFCGSGKTRLGAWTFQALGRPATAVFAPGLALLLGILEEWSPYLDGVRPVLVCSLPDLEASALFPEGVTATTDPKELELIKDDRCVYFCTYMSLPVLQAGTGRRGVGLGIFDEAHRTAGCTDRLYSQGLVDDEFPMKHRLFLTATAKHVDGDGSPVFSMEDEGTYGPVASTLSCREAIELGIICDYSIIGLDIGLGSVSDRLSRTADQLAARIGSQQTRKIITYHQTIASARAFQGELMRLQGEGRLEGYSLLHLNGNMSTRETLHILAEFKRLERAIITNARCLAEGINVHGVDTVAFIEPKSSDIGIVQAIGRALRRDPACLTKRAEIVVPLEDGTTQDFKALRTVISAMKEVDLRLTGSKAKEHVLVPDRHQRHSEGKCTARFEDRLGDLRSFFEKERHLFVPGTTSLGLWWRNVKLSAWNGELSDRFRIDSADPFSSRVRVHLAKTAETPFQDSFLAANVRLRDAAEQMQMRQTRLLSYLLRRRPVPPWVAETIVRWLSEKGQQRTALEIMVRPVREVEETGPAQYSPAVEQYLKRAHLPRTAISYEQELALTAKLKLADGPNLLTPEEREQLHLHLAVEAVKFLDRHIDIEESPDVVSECISKIDFILSRRPPDLCYRISASAHIWFYRRWKEFENEDHPVRIPARWPESKRFQFTPLDTLKGEIDAEGNLLPIEPTFNADKSWYQPDEMAILLGHVANLPDASRAIISERFLREDPKSFKKLGAEYPLARERIREMSKRAVGVLKRRCMADGLPVEERKIAQMTPQAVRQSILNLNKAFCVAERLPIECVKSRRIFTSFIPSDLEVVEVCKKAGIAFEDETFRKAAFRRNRELDPRDYMSEAERLLYYELLSLKGVAHRRELVVVCEGKGIPLGLLLAQAPFIQRFQQNVFGLVGTSVTASLLGHVVRFGSMAVAETHQQSQPALDKL